MIFDHRTYTIQPGKTNEYVKIFEEFAYPIAKKHGLELTAYFVSKVGRLNQVVHIWQYNDIMEFEIEGISIGDSLLDFFSEEEINNNVEDYYNDNKYKYS